MQDHHKNGLSAIEYWSSIVSNTSTSLTSSSKQAMIEQAISAWLAHIYWFLGNIKGCPVPKHLQLAIKDELLAMDYQPGQALRAMQWIKHGDWTYRGSDPRLELSDFTPTEQQYLQTQNKLHAQADTNRYFAKDKQHDNKQYMTDAQLNEWAIYILTAKPDWGMFNGIPWFERNRGIANTLLADPSYVPQMPRIDSIGVETL